MAVEATLEAEAVPAAGTVVSGAEVAGAVVAGAVVAGAVVEEARAVGGGCGRTRILI